MEDTSEFNIADTYVLDDNVLKSTENMGITGILKDLDDEDLAETYVLDDGVIQQADDQNMTGILRDLDEAENDALQISQASSGYTIELSLDDDD